MASVLRDWVMELSLRHQGTLLTGMRGCDVQPKLPLDATARHLTAFLRWCVCNPADEREVDQFGAFMQSRPPYEWKASELGHLPQHYYAHLMHCFEVIGVHHSDERTRLDAHEIYIKLVRNLHLWPESAAELHERLTEDRIVAGTVVS